MEFITVIAVLSVRLSVSLWIVTAPALLAVHAYHSTSILHPSDPWCSRRPFIV